jgi:hypothetical protein
MDRRAFLALLTLASAATTSPAFARQLRLAHATGNMRVVSREKLTRAVYNVLRARDGTKVVTKALVQLGRNKEEAAQIARTARSIALKSGSYRNFNAVLQGNAPTQVQLSAQDTALLRSVTSQGGLFRVWQGDTWEGHGGNTWEGHGGNTWQGRSASSGSSRGGNTWEGSGGRTWEGTSRRGGTYGNVTPK